MGDTGNALLAAIAITTALYHRDRTGEGQAVSTSIVNAGLLHTSYAWIHSDGTTPDWGQVDGDQFGLSPYYRLYQSALGEWVFLAALTSQAQTKLETLIPGEPSGDDAESVAGWLESYFETTVASEAFAALDDGGVPIEVVDESFCRDLFDDPDARRLGLISRDPFEQCRPIRRPRPARQHQPLRAGHPAGSVCQRGAHHGDPG